MREITEIISYNKIDNRDTLRCLFGDRRILMFDIETTGLSPDSSFIYLIGINQMTIDGWRIIQLFNDDGRSEHAIISAFMSYLDDCDVLIEFNGDRFDIPYVTKRLNTINHKLSSDASYTPIADCFHTVTSYDILRSLRPYKKSIGLPNMKQKTLERYLGINRVDRYSGGELIDVYLNYVTTGSEYNRELVLRHNRDDMEGMLLLLPILSLCAIEHGTFTPTELSTVDTGSGLKLIIEADNPVKAPKKLISAYEGIGITIDGTHTELRIPVTTDCLRYYYEDSKLYDEHTGFFVPALKYSSPTLPTYSYRQRDKHTYLELSDSLLGNPDNLKAYMQHMLSCVLRCSDISDS